MNSKALLLPWAFSLLFVSSTEASSAFGPGEQTTYEVSYLGVCAGTAQVTVGARASKWGQEVYPIVAVAKTDPKLFVYPVKDRFVTYWQPDSQRTLGNDFYADENRKRRRQQIRLDHATGTATVLRQKEGGEENSGTYDFEPNSADVAAAVFALRNLPIAVGSEHVFPIFADGKQFKLKTRADAIEVIDTALGPKEVFRISVETNFGGKFEAKREIRAFFTTDPLHLLVRLEADLVLGTLVATITDFKPGGQLASSAELVPGKG